VQNDIQQRAMDFQPAVVVNESQFSEAVHEETDSRAGCAYHLGQGLLTDRGDYAMGDPVLTEVSKHEQNTSQPLFAGVEKLIHQVRFVSDVPQQQIRYEQVGERVLLVKRPHHCGLFDPQKGAVRHGACRADTSKLPGQSSFSEEVSDIQYADRRFLAALRNDCEPHMAGLNIEDCVGCFSLRKDCAFFGNYHDSPALANRGEERLGVEVALFLGRFGWHLGFLPHHSRTPRGGLYRCLDLSFGALLCTPANAVSLIPHGG
jgi:hypothetical protein